MEDDGAGANEQTFAFTPAQQEAIGHGAGNLQLIACAGSGKTEVVAQRVVALLDGAAGEPLKPANIVAFTFTDKAAAELKERITKRCREKLGEIHGMAEMFVGTIHAFCLDLLKTEAPKYLKYEVLNEVQQSLFVDRLSARSGLTTSQTLAGQPLRRYIDTRHYVSALSILREADLNEPALRGCSVVEGLENYAALLDERRYLDYSSIMVAAVDTISRDEGLQERMGERIKHVIVDEYQDVNPIQERLVEHLHTLGASVCVVGDDDQTIYQWRGSDVTNILSFRARYPDVHQVRLQENWRSSPGIVETARQFIAQNTNRLEKQMEPTHEQPFDDGDIVALSFKTPEEEADYIVETIRQLRGTSFSERGTSRGLSYSDCAILLRSVAKNAQPVTDALRAARIPFIITGMNNLFDTIEAEAARHLFYFLAEHQGANEGSVRAMWQAADLGIDEAVLDDAIARMGEARDAIKSGQEQRFSVYSLQRSFLSFLEDIHLREETVPEHGEGRARGEVVFYNLGKFSQLISDFEAIHYKSDPKAKYEEFARFLQYRAETAYPEGWQDNQYANPDAVRIMTAHKSKGLEFPVVFLPSLIKNRFPSKAWGGRTVWHLIPRDGVVDQDRYEGSLEDERRLFYVAMTRSQKFLFMTWAPIGDNRIFQQASIFWQNVLHSKWVRRRPFDYSSRPKMEPQPKSGVANVVFSFSDVKYYFECPYQFKLRILYGFNAPIHEALGYGKSLHDALADVHSRAARHESVSVDEVPDLLARHLHLPYAYPTLRNTLETSADKVLRKYFKDNEELFDKVEFAEKSVELHLGEGVSVVGRIDLVRRIDTNETYIVDLKSSERAQEEDVTEAQLHVYALGYRELTGRDADYVEIYELDEGIRKPRSVDDAFITDVRIKVQNAADALRAGNLPALPEAKKCQNCDYCKMCTAGAPYAKGRTDDSKPAPESVQVKWNPEGRR